MSNCSFKLEKNTTLDPWIWYKPVRLNSRSLSPCLSWAFSLSHSLTRSSDPPRWAHMVPGCAEHAQPSRWITLLPHPPLGTDSHPSSSVRTLCHSPRILAQLHFPPRWENHHLLKPKSPDTPPPPNLNLLPSPHLYPSGRKQHLPLLPHFLLSESFLSFFLFSCRDFFYAPTCAGKMRWTCHSLFWLRSRLPQLRLYFQWQVMSGHLICSCRQPWPPVSPWPRTPRKQVPGINHTFLHTPAPHPPTSAGILSIHPQYPLGGGLSSLQQH